MEMPTMGAVRVTARIENLGDLHQAELGALPADRVRRVEVHDALVDTGAPILSMPKRLIDQLGLRPVRTRRARTSAGPTTVQIHGTARLMIQGRDCPTDVAEVSDDCPVLIGQNPLELLDYVVDPVNQRLIGNPEHGGEQMLDMF